LNLDLYKRLFIHRTDVFAKQHEGGAYTPVRRPITDEDIEEHLAGLWSIGTYTTEPTDQTVKCVVFDLDTHDPETTEVLMECVERFVVSAGGNTTSLLRETSGNKGTHVWLFFSEPVEAAKVRRWLARDFLPLWSEASGGVGLEIFPKQDSV
jgi:hypothetical protein